MRMIADILVDLSPEERALMREMRIATRMPAKVFANLAGCSVRALQSWEYGERKPRIGSYRRWRCALDAQCAAD